MSLFSIFTATAHAMGTPPAGAGTQSGASVFIQFVPLVLIFAIFYFLLIRPQQKKAKEHQDYLSSLKKGDEVMTSGGIIGRITGVTELVVTLELADNVRIKVARSYIAGKPPAKAESPAKS